MKHTVILFFSIFFIFITKINAQPPTIPIKWQKSFGSSMNESSYSIKQTNDGGYIVGANTGEINDGDVTNYHGGGSDFWVIKLDSIGHLIWQKALGGSRFDLLEAIEQTSDSGYIAVGYSNSNDGDVSGHHGSTNRGDVWLVKISSNGNLQWQKSFGGLQNENAFSIKQTTEGGYIFAGYSNSNDGDVSGHHGDTLLQNDMWIVKIDSIGNLQWQKSLGGSYNEEANSILQTTDGGYIVAGYTRSNDGDVTGIHNPNSRGQDYWIVKLNNSGSLQWQKCLGGSQNDYATSIQQAANGGYIVTGASYSNNGDVSGNHGGSDVWVVRLNSDATIFWQKCFGGTQDEYATTIQQTIDGNFILVGTTNSTDGDVNGSYGGADIWVVKFKQITNPNFTVTAAIQWQKVLGGSGSDAANGYRCIQQTYDGNFIVTGNSNSNDGDVTGNHGMSDVWVAKLGSPVCFPSDISFSIGRCGSYNFNGRILTQSGVYKDTLTNYFGCDSFITLTLAIYPFPVAGTISGDTNLCVRDSTILTASIPGGVWGRENDNVTVSQTGMVTAIYGAGQPGYITYTTTNGYGCSTVIKKGIMVNTFPSVTSISGSSVACKGSSYQYSSSPIGGIWSLNNPTVASINQYGILTGVLSGSTNIIYTVTNNGCSRQVTKELFVINNPDVPTITQIRDTLYSSIIISDASYKWYRNGTLISTTSVPYLKITNIGNYTLTIQINANGCNSTSSIFTASTVTKIWNKTSTLNSFLLYPNPVSQVLNIDIISKQNNTVQSRVFNISGKEVYNQILPITKGENTYKMDVSHFAKGIYIIHLQDTNGIATDKFVVE